MSETVRLLPPGIDLGATDEPVKSPFWKNMLFLTDGTTRISTEVWSTEGEAKRKADEWLVYARGYEFWDDLETGGKRHSTEFSHIIQLPWNKPCR
jgi:hypothetical protein